MDVTHWFVVEDLTFSELRKIVNCLLIDAFVVMLAIYLREYRIIKKEMKMERNVSKEFFWQFLARKHILIPIVSNHHCPQNN